MKRSLKKLLTAALCLGVVGVGADVDAAKIPADASAASSSKIVAEKFTGNALMIHGTGDIVVPYTYSLSYKKKLSSRRS